MTCVARLLCTEDATLNKDEAKIEDQFSTYRQKTIAENQAGIVQEISLEKRPLKLTKYAESGYGL